MSSAVNPRNDTPDSGNAPEATRSDDSFNRDRRSVVEREKEQMGGMKFGACFFGWLTATGTAVLVTALLSAAGAAFGLGTTMDPTAQADATTIGLAAGIALLVVVFVAYFSGGYVAGRMARFDGVKQGLGVWLWAIIIAVVVAVLGLIAGNQFDVLTRLNGFPRIPINEGTLTTGGIVAAIAVVILSLVGAILGGLTGMRYHRKIDKIGLGR